MPNLLVNFFIRGKHDNLNLSYLSQSSYDSPKRAITKNSNFFCCVNNFGRTWKKRLGFCMLLHEL